MKRRTIYITEKDKERLEELILVARDFSSDPLNNLEKLSNELSAARIVPSEEIPGNIVTMNSRVELSYEGFEDKSICTLVFPKDVPLDENNVSVLAPAGTAILGYAEGDTVKWELPSGICEIRIEKILYQPEAAGRFDL